MTEVIDACMNLDCCKTYFNIGYLIILILLIINIYLIFKLKKNESSHHI